MDLLSQMDTCSGCCYCLCSGRTFIEVSAAVWVINMAIPFAGVSVSYLNLLKKFGLPELFDSIKALAHELCRA
jgi:hypothetical protein